MSSNNSSNNNLNSIGEKIESYAIGTICVVVNPGPYTKAPYNMSVGDLVKVVGVKSSRFPDHPNNTLITIKVVGRKESTAVIFNWRVRPTNYTRTSPLPVGSKAKIVNNNNNDHYFIVGTEVEIQEVYHEGKDKSRRSYRAKELRGSLVQYINDKHMEPVEEQVSATPAATAEAYTYKAKKYPLSRGDYVRIMDQNNHSLKVASKGYIVHDYGCGKIEVQGVSRYNGSTIEQTLYRSQVAHWDGVKQDQPSTETTRPETAAPKSVVTERPRIKRPRFRSDTQNGRLFAAMLIGRRITRASAALMGIQNVTARFADLRNRGVDVVCALTKDDTTSEWYIPKSEIARINAMRP